LQCLRNLIQNSERAYHLGIIDYLQQWDFGKKSENLTKRLLAKNPKKISAVEPELYKERFNSFVVDRVLKHNNLEKNSLVKNINIVN